MLRATVVELVEGLAVCEPRGSRAAGTGSRERRRRPAAGSTSGIAHCRGAGHRGGGAAGRPRRAPRPNGEDRVLLVDEGPAVDRSTAWTLARRPRSESTTTASRDGGAAAEADAPRAGSGTSGPGGSSSRPAPSSARSSSPTTTGRGSCSPARRGRTSSGMASARAPGRGVHEQRRATDGAAGLEAAGVEIVEIVDPRAAPRQRHGCRRRAPDVRVASPGSAGGPVTSRRTSCSCRAAGTRTSRSGARRGARSGSTSARRVRPRPVGPHVRIEAVGAAAGDEGAGRSRRSGSFAARARVD